MYLYYCPVEKEVLQKYWDGDDTKHFDKFTISVVEETTYDEECKVIVFGIKKKVRYLTALSLCQT